MVEVKIIPTGVTGLKQKTKKTPKKRKPLPSRAKVPVDPNMKRAITGLMRQNALENKPLTKKELDKLIIQQMNVDTLYKSKEELNADLERLKEHAMRPYNGPEALTHTPVIDEAKNIKKEYRKNTVVSNKLVRKKEEQLHSNARSLQKERKLKEARDEIFMKYFLYKARAKEEQESDQ